MKSIIIAVLLALASAGCVKSYYLKTVKAADAPTVNNLKIVLIPENWEERGNTTYQVFEKALTTELIERGFTMIERNNLKDVYLDLKKVVFADMPVQSVNNPSVNLKIEGVGKPETEMLDVTSMKSDSKMASIAPVLPGLSLSGVTSVRKIRELTGADIVLLLNVKISCVAEENGVCYISSVVAHFVDLESAKVLISTTFLADENSNMSMVNVMKEISKSWKSILEGKVFYEMQTGIMGPEAVER